MVLAGWHGRESGKKHFQLNCNEYDVQSDVAPNRADGFEGSYLGIAFRVPAIVPRSFSNVSKALVPVSSRMLGVLAVTKGHRMLTLNLNNAIGLRLADDAGRQ
ncbi:phenylalanyl-tRNA synthase subunit beta [Anopheles sinensis]|uniref:Phenylalanyl-tRNA synthase subunit beta n=1 Tax=Anopheles sinensis TaxID=74873 RepID=A0A084WJD1_ANOSI|nr:phenylalanyl-tRNA synthase subunit beta [Anopheles sinensis]